MEAPVLLHIPHAGTYVPEEEAAKYVCDIEEELHFMTDWYTDELFDYPARKLVFPVSRLVCDMERFRDDSEEEMAKRGMGACYTNGHDGRVIRRLDAKEKESLLRRLYDPHHEALTRTTAEMLSRHNKCTIIDCHSFYPRPLPYEPDQNADRPDICIGTDGFHTPKELVHLVAEDFLKMGYSVKLNSPYSGSMVPAKYYRRDSRFTSVMIEVNRGLYLDGRNRKSRSFQVLKKDLSAVIERIVEQCSAAAIIRDYLKLYADKTYIIGNCVAEKYYEKDDFDPAKGLPDEAFDEWKEMVKDTANEFDELLKLTGTEFDVDSKDWPEYKKKRDALTKKAFADLAEIYADLVD